MHTVRKGPDKSPGTEEADEEVQVHNDVNNQVHSG